MGPQYTRARPGAAAMAALVVVFGQGAAARAADAIAPEPPAKAADAESAPDAEPPSGLGPLGGKVFAYARTPVDMPFQQVSASAWFEARPRLGPTYARVVLTGDAVDVDVSGRREWLRGRVREAYVGLRKSRWDLRLGQQIIPWGSSDVVNPTDLLTARDYTFFSADPEANRLGTISALLAWSPPGSGLTITLVGTPILQGSTILVPPSALPHGVILGDTAQPRADLENAEGAVKIKYAGDGWDVAAVGFRGYDHLPELEVRSVDPASGTVTIGQTYHRQWGGGIDGSASFGKWIVRLEGAYLRTENPDGADPRIVPSYATGVLGLERAFFERLRVQAQLVARYYPEYRSPDGLQSADPARTAVERAVARANALLLDYQDQLRPASTLRIAWSTEDERLDVEVFGAINWTGYDYFLRPMLGWHASDALLLQLGLEQWAGGRSHPLGALQPYSGAFLQGTFTF